MKCGLCKSEAVLVDNGKDIGIYYFCRSCKLEQKEWEARTPKLEDPPEKKKWMDLVGYDAELERAFEELEKVVLPAAKNAPAKKPVALKDMQMGFFNDCGLCGAPAGADCALHCPVGGKTYD